MKSIILLTAALSQTPAASVVDQLVGDGYEFVLVTTKNGADSVLVNQGADGLEFKVVEATCRTQITAKSDPVYDGETLGVLSLECDNHGVKTVSSASCSPRFPEVQSHFEIQGGQDSYILDLVCRVR